MEQIHKDLTEKNEDRMKDGGSNMETVVSIKLIFGKENQSVSDYALRTDGEQARADPRRAYGEDRRRPEQDGNYSKY